ncbi:DUF4190 domain-containing protein [Streptomyces fragilis]|uniref:DUF4190 domain-containing protein n=1 Tax=Streptomyces fragilis TaxID=67301 RepID=A0ABV2YFU1_9ACTN|nr:DUF4190 domain-containing protein [Streptomyces fragilis]
MSQQMPYAPVPPPPMPPYQQPPKNGMGTAGLVLGIIALVLTATVILSALGGVLGILALVFGIIGISKTKKGEATNKGAAVTGVVLGALSVVAAAAITIASVFLVNKLGDDIAKDLDRLEKEAGSTSAPLDPGTEESADEAGPEGEAANGKPFTIDEVAEWEDGVSVSIDKIAKFSPSDVSAGHEKGNDAYKVTVVVENTTKKNYKLANLMVDATAGENGTPGSQVFDFDSGLELNAGTVAPGKKATLVYGFSVEAGAKSIDLSITPDFMSEPVVWELKTP